MLFNFDHYNFAIQIIKKNYDQTTYFCSEMRFTEVFAS